jgi:ATP-dependent helicase/nuclease subunit A
MSDTVLARANAEQRYASDPLVSAFVAASAGSGKTKLLTDRLLRLMLGGAAPERILCLTFTRAAAAEMAIRLQRRLGAWVRMDDAALDHELRALDIEPDAAARSAARRLFARVLDLPGGMRIGTIHAFCQSLLRRFPLEAALSPHFQVVDEAASADALAESREHMLAHASAPAMLAALQPVAGLVKLDEFGELVDQLRGDPRRWARLAARGPDAVIAAQREALGLRFADEAGLLADAACGGDGNAVRDALTLIAGRGADKARARAAGLLDWLAQAPAARAAAWEDWARGFLTAKGEPAAASTLFGRKLAESEPGAVAVLQAEQARIVAVEQDRAGLRAAEVSAALLRLAVPVIEAYAGRKEVAGLLDYADLIGRSHALLRDPGAAWVLFKLDGGLDHLLLDEVQDTAPAQWDIAGALSEEFFAGAGAREAADEPVTRTVFAVGDRKQSIYSFQGADPAGFDLWRGRMRARVEAAGERWVDGRLDVSFRSTAPVLALVDAVFASPLAADGVVAPGEPLRHFAARSLHAGKVELWPLAPLPEEPPREPWTTPDRYEAQVSAPQRLAETLAEWIAGQTSGAVMLESRGRPLAPGDVLVLLRRRNAFASALLRALKARGVPVAGLDRMVLTEQPAVQDLMALADVLLLPEDDLTLAELLVSPLGGLSDDSLMALAVGRPGTLWDALRTRAAERAEWRVAHDFIATLRRRADYATPHALLAEALGPLGGRARLFARLGPEAAEPVDELLGAALTYARLNPPSLQGFLHWLRRSGAEVKRETEAAGHAVRIMTVHGAKGLQAPLVILPDTTALPPARERLFWAGEGEEAVPLWCPNAGFRSPEIERRRQEGLQRATEEYNRLLYVALTRAEDRLLVCGWAGKQTVPARSWYGLVADGFAALGAHIAPFDAWEGDVLTLASPQQAAPERAARAEAAPPPPLPAWAGGPSSTPSGWRAAPLPAEPALPQPLAPSRPEGVELGPVPAAASPLEGRAARELRFRRGQLIHSLLQHLPDLPAAERRAAGRLFLDRPGQGIGAGEGIAKGEAGRILDEVLAVIDHPELAALFGPDGRAEVPLTGVVAGQVIGGLVDRLAVLPDRVLLADYKTNREPPATAAATPVLYLRQMAAYRAVLAGVFPGRTVTCALVWTRAGRVDLLPAALLDAHAPGVRETGVAAALNPS